MQEMQQHRVESDLELKRMHGALDESRKMLLDMSLGPNLTEVSDPRVPQLQQELALEKRRMLELLAQKEDCERRVSAMEAAAKSSQPESDDPMRQRIGDEKQ